MIVFFFHLQRHFATVKMSTISFCSLDPKNKKIFAFINRKKKRNFCHVFQCHEGDVSLYKHTGDVMTLLHANLSLKAQKMVETMAEGFEFTFKLLEQSKQKDEVCTLSLKHTHTLALMYIICTMKLITNHKLKVITKPHLTNAINIFIDV